MAVVDDSHDLIGRQMLLSRKQRVGNLDTLMSRIDIVAAQ